jgi:hypothetical protein
MPEPNTELSDHKRNIKSQQYTLQLAGRPCSATWLSKSPARLGSKSPVTSNLLATLTLEIAVLIILGLAITLNNNCLNHFNVRRSL